MIEPRVAPVGLEHAGELFTVQRAAYVSEAQRYGEPDIPPLTETFDEVLANLRAPGVVVRAAWWGDRLVGSVRGWPDGARMEVARFAVAPDMQGRGIGRALLTAIEAAAPPPVRTLWLRTGARSAENLRLYAKAGYRAVSEMTDSVGIGLVVLEKALTDSVPA